MGARALNIIYRRMKEKNGGVGTPEMRYLFPSHCLPEILIGGVQTSTVDGFCYHTTYRFTHLRMDCQCQTILVASR